MHALLVSAATLLYVLAAALLGRRLALGVQATRESKYLPLGLAMAGIVLHGAALYTQLLAPGALNLSFFNMGSLILWLVAVLVVITAFGQPLENLGIIVLPLAAVALVADRLAPPNPTMVSDLTSGLQVHILLSVVSYSLLALGSVQALLLAVQDHQLRNRHPGGFVRALPPLETMEGLLFQLIGLGFVLLTLSLLSGTFFVEDLFAQHLVHKTVLSIVAWCVFGTLLWGRLQFGWRGRTAIRWTLAGFVVLALAYFGSKLVLELILR